jgi:tetratricopeptide (TPR) repeat protein
LIGLTRSLGGLYMELGRYDEAEPVLLDVLALRQRVLPPEHPDIATSLNDLGELYYRQGEAGKAEPLFTQMMDIRRKSLSPGHPDFIAGLFYMAELYHSMGRLEDAAAQLREAVSLLAHLPDSQAELLFARQSLANLYMEGDCHEKAIPLYEAMLTTQSELSRPDSPVMLRLIDDLGMLYLGQDRLDEAAASWEKWLSLQDGKLALDNADRLKVMRNLACTYKALQKYQEAKALLLHIMSVRVEHDHGDVELKVQSVAEAAEMHYFLAEYPVAETLYRTLFTLVEPQWSDGSAEKMSCFNGWWQEACWTKPGVRNKGANAGQYGVTVLADIH